MNIYILNFHTKTVGINEKEAYAHFYIIAKNKKLARKKMRNYLHNNTNFDSFIDDIVWAKLKLSHIDDSVINYEDKIIGRAFRRSRKLVLKEFNRAIKKIHKIDFDIFGTMQIVKFNFVDGRILDDKLEKHEENINNIFANDDRDIISQSMFEGSRRVIMERLWSNNY